MNHGQLLEKEVHMTLNLYRHLAAVKKLVLSSTDFFVQDKIFPFNFFFKETDSNTPTLTFLFRFFFKNIVITKSL
jgi:hypothetical protein